MINVCKGCGYIKKGCLGCNSKCPVCGDKLERKDYVKVMLAKAKNDKNN